MPLPRTHAYTMTADERAAMHARRAVRRLLDPETGRWIVRGPEGTVRVGDVTVTREDGTTHVVRVTRTWRTFCAELGVTATYGEIDMRSLAPTCPDCGRAIMRPDQRCVEHGIGIDSLMACIDVYECAAGVAPGQPRRSLPPDSMTHRMRARASDDEDFAYQAEGL